MKIKILREISFDKFTEMLREVPLKQKAEDGSGIKVYKDANITWRKSLPSEVNPTTFYLIRSNLELQQGLRERLLSEGIDSLHLDGALEIENEKGELWTLAPPIIELTSRTVQYKAGEGEINYEESVTIQVPIINDGAHRVFLAREGGFTFNGIWVSNVDKKYPFYAHPNGWDLVKIVDSVPKTMAEKKLYLREDCYALYRDFSFVGLGGPRYTSDKNGR